MLDMGFEPDVRRILGYLTEDSTPSRVRSIDYFSPSSDTHVQRYVSEDGETSRERFFDG